MTNDGANEDDVCADQVSQSLIPDYLMFAYLGIRTSKCLLRFRSDSESSSLDHSRSC